MKNNKQNNIVKNNAGIYQYELARFKSSQNGISEFQDMRTFLDFSSIYSTIQTQFRAVLDELEEELADVEDGSYYQKKITDGTELPSGGTTGDIYIQYFD